MGISTSAGNEGLVRIHIDGPMTIYDAAGLRHELLAALDDQAREFDLALENVDEMDTAGLQLLLMAWNEAARTGRHIHLVAASEAVKEVLDRYCLWSLLDQPALNQ